MCSEQCYGLILSQRLEIYILVLRALSLVREPLDKPSHNGIYQDGENCHTRNPGPNLDYPKSLWNSLVDLVDVHAEDTSDERQREVDDSEYGQYHCHFQLALHVLASSTCTEPITFWISSLTVFVMVLTLSSKSLRIPGRLLMFIGFVRPKASEDGGMRFPPQNLAGLSNAVRREQATYLPLSWQQGDVL